MGNILISPASTGDYSAILALNEEAVPAVNSIPQARLAHLHGQSAYLGVAREDDVVAGFLLVLSEAADYDSINFGYFKRHYPRFLYIDRIVVHPAFRGRGVGAALYADLERSLAAPGTLLTCEVNLRPPNPGSLRFHEALGFRAVGEQDTENGSKRVCLMARLVGENQPLPA